MTEEATIATAAAAASSEGNEGGNEGGAPAAAPANTPPPADNPAEGEKPEGTPDPTGEGEGNDGGEKPDATGEGEGEGAPDEYTEFTLPEGIEADTDLMTGFKALAKELKLTQSQAQKLVDLQAGALKQAADAAEQQSAQGWKDLMSEWTKATQSDQEYGGDKLEQSTGLIARGIKAFGTPEFNEMLITTGAGNHPEMNRFLYRLGKAISDDQVLIGTQGAPQLSREQRMYPSMNQN